MAGISDSGQPDDVRVHLEIVAQADLATSHAPEGETEAQRRLRVSIALPGALRARLERALAEVRAQAPGLSHTELVKVEATRAGRDALAAGRTALSRVDAHLRSRTGERNPEVGRVYGVYGANPTSFGGVLRALSLSHGEQARRAALPEGAPERELLFTPVIEDAVRSALDGMSAVLGRTIATRAELLRAISLKRETIDGAEAVLRAVREHLYANLPNGRKDEDLRDYGFRPVAPGRRRAAREEREEPAEA